jgi:hypothetical protein
VWVCECVCERKGAPGGREARDKEHQAGEARFRHQIRPEQLGLEAMQRCQV